MRAGARVGPFYVSSSTRRRRSRGPTAAQRRAQAAALAEQQAIRRAEVVRARLRRRTLYGPYRIADVRTWFSGQWLLSLAALAVVIALPAMLGDGAAEQAVWLAAVAVGILVWGVWVARLHASQAPERRAAVEEMAQVRREADAAAARQAAEHAAYMAPRQVGNSWHHGACVINHRSADTAARCGKG